MMGPLGLDVCDWVLDDFRCASPVMTRPEVRLNFMPAAVLGARQRRQVSFGEPEQLGAGEPVSCSVEDHHIRGYGPVSGVRLKMHRTSRRYTVLPQRSFAIGVETEPSCVFELLPAWTMLAWTGILRRAVTVGPVSQRCRCEHSRN